MTTGETSLAIAILVVGLYLIAVSLGALELQIHHLVGLAVTTFGVSYTVLGRSRESAFWGGVLSILGAAVAFGGGASPLLVVGIMLVFVALFALLAGRR